MAERVYTVQTSHEPIDLVEYVADGEDGEEGEARRRLCLRIDVKKPFHLTRDEAKLLGSTLVKWANQKEELRSRLLQIAAGIDEGLDMRLDNADFVREIANALEGLDP